MRSALIEPAAGAEEVLLLLLLLVLLRHHRDEGPATEPESNHGWQVRVDGDRIHAPCAVLASCPAHLATGHWLSSNLGFRARHGFAPVRSGYAALSRADKRKQTGQKRNLQRASEQERPPDRKGYDLGLRDWRMSQQKKKQNELQPQLIEFPAVQMTFDETPPHFALLVQTFNHETVDCCGDRARHPARCLVKNGLLPQNHGSSGGDRTRVCRRRPFGLA